MKYLFLVILGLLTMSKLYGQFWVGPKFGGQLATHNYQSKTRLDSFDIKSDFNFHAGIAIDYQTEGRFGVHTEITYLRMGTQVVNKDMTAAGALLDIVDSRATHHFLTAPMLARVVFGTGQLKFFVNAGPRLSYWLGSSGNIEADELIEAGEMDIDYKVVYGSFNEFIGESNIQIIESPNRLQYALDIGGGIMFDISEEQRIMLDLRYSFGHSNMAFNEGNSLADLAEYQEDMEYRSNMFMFSVAYLIGYSPSMQKKGKSSIKRK